MMPRISSAFLLCLLSASSAFVLTSPTAPPSPAVTPPSLLGNNFRLSVIPAPKVLDETLEHLNLHPYNLTALTSGFCNDVYKVSCPNKPDQVCKVFSKMAKARGLDLGSVDKVRERNTRSEATKCCEFLGNERSAEQETTEELVGRPYVRNYRRWTLISCKCAFHVIYGSIGVRH